MNRATPPWTEPGVYAAHVPPAMQMETLAAVRGLACEGGRTHSTARAASRSQTVPPLGPAAAGAAGAVLSVLTVCETMPSFPPASRARPCTSCAPSDQVAVSTVSALDLTSAPGDAHGAGIVKSHGRVSVSRSTDRSRRNWSRSIPVLSRPVTAAVFDPRNQPPPNSDPLSEAVGLTVSEIVIVAL